MDKDKVYIECDGLVKIYKTEELEVMALQGLDFEIEKGEIMAVIGKSGSGKSTLMNIIGGLERPTAGKIIVDGVNLADMTEREMNEYRKTKVGFVWQKSSRNMLGYLSAQDNIINAMSFSGKSMREKKKKAKRLLEMVGLPNKSGSYPNQMSGGEQQRVAIAIALANDPEILLADEPTGAVDTKTSDHIQELFKHLNKTLGITIIIVTHDYRLAERVDRAVMISDGKISSEKRGREAEYTVLDKARRLQLRSDMLEDAGIDSNRVKVTVKEGQIIISKQDKIE